MKVQSETSQPVAPFVLPRIEGKTAQRIKQLSKHTSVSENRLANMACEVGIAAVEKRFNVKQVVTALILLIATSASGIAADWAGFVRAIHSVESSGRTTGHIIGDGGRSLGPLQISRAYHTDSRMPGSYESVTNLTYATATMRAYLQRYAPKALAAGESAGDWQACARIHNGGPRGMSRATLGYWRKVEGKL